MQWAQRAALASILLGCASTAAIAANVDLIGANKSSRPQAQQIAQNANDLGGNGLIQQCDRLLHLPLVIARDRPLSQMLPSLKAYFLDVAVVEAYRSTVPIEVDDDAG